MTTRRTRQLLILGGDMLLFFGALWISLYIRSGSYISFAVYERYIPLFLVICGIFVTLQYIVGAYDAAHERTPLSELRSSFIAATVTFLLSTLFFYLLPNSTISPKTILVLTIGLASIFGYIFRSILSIISSRSTHSERIGIIGTPTHPDIIELQSVLLEQKDISIIWVEETPTEAHLHSVQKIVFHNELSASEQIKKLLYTHAVGKQQIITFSELYESVCKKIPTGSLNNDWFITHVQKNSVMYERIKNLIDYLFGIILFGGLVVVGLPISLLIVLTSKGPIYIKQTRIGKNGHHFSLYKFRTMYALAPDGSAEMSGAVFSTKGDARITPVGRILRQTRLDELPQAINLLKRDISIIGPRPERPEIVAHLKEEAPYFSARTLVMPGITGWAAVHQHYTDTKASTIEKLQYDLYYIKHRSLWIDMKILLLTVRTIINLNGQ